MIERQLMFLNEPTLMQ